MPNARRLCSGVMTADLRHLRAFLAIAAEGSVTRAAARLHVTQPALSRTLRQLEQHLGVRLVDRSTHHLRLTAAGEEVRLSGGQVGLRRAEFEGQIQRLREHPELLGLLAEAFADANPDAPELVEVQMVHRKFELADGKPTGDYTDTVVVEYDLEDGDS